MEDDARQKSYRDFVRQLCWRDCKNLGELDLSFGAVCMQRRPKTGAFESSAEKFVRRKLIGEEPARDARLNGRLGSTSSIYFDWNKTQVFLSRGSTLNSHGLSPNGGHQIVLPGKQDAWTAIYLPLDDSVATATAYIGHWVVQKWTKTDEGWVTPLGEELGLREALAETRGPLSEAWFPPAEKQNLKPNDLRGYYEESYLQARHYRRGKTLHWAGRDFQRLEPADPCVPLDQLRPGRVRVEFDVAVECVFVELVRFSDADYERLKKMGPEAVSFEAFTFTGGRPRRRTWLFHDSSDSMFFPVDFADHELYETLWPERFGDPRDLSRVERPLATTKIDERLYVECGILD